MSKKLIAGVLSLVLAVSSTGIDVFAMQTGNEPETGNPAVTAVAADEEEQAVPEDGKRAPEDEQVTSEDEQVTPEDEKAAPEDEKTAPEDEQAVTEDAQEPGTDGENTDDAGKDDDLAVDANGDAGTYTVRYYPNGPVAEPVTEEVNTDEEYEVKECPFTWDGYKFTKWNTSADASGTGYEPEAAIPGNTFAAGENFDLYAIWEKESYKITYYPNGGTNDKDNPSKYDVETAVVFKDPVRKGYKFGGWFKEAGFVNRITEIPMGSTGDVELYAKWTPCRYTVRFYGNASSGGSMKEMTCEYDKQYNLTANGFTKKGHTFTCWNTKADGSGSKYADKAAVKNLSENDGSVINLYAQWNKDTYTITYKLNGGKNDAANPKSYTVTTNTIKLKDATRKGYTFAGWFSDSKYKSRVTKIAKGSTGNMILYAKWTANKYTVKFNGNGATSGSMSDMKNRRYGREFKLNANKFKKKGYKFAGWNTKRNGKGKAYSNKAAVKNLTSKNNGKVTLYAQWSIKDYTITYVLNKGKNNKSNPTTYNVKTKTIVLKPAKRTGYTFKGWYRDKSFKHKVTKIKKGSTGNRTLYAKWKVNKYRIRFYPNKAEHGSMDDLKGLKYGKTYRLSANAYRRDGYTFKEWNTKADGSGKSYDDKASVKNLSKKDGATVKLYAIWTPIKYTIVFKGNGSTSGSMSSITCKYGYRYVLTANSFVRKKYKFDCWNTKRDGSGKSFADKDTVSNLTLIDGDRIVLYAQWDEDFKEISMNVSKPSKDDIEWFINTHQYSSSDTYATPPSLAEPYNAGSLSTQTQLSTLNLLNTYRYIAGVHTNVGVSDTYSDRAAKGALVNKLNNALSHYPARPAVLSDPKYNQLFEDAKDGCEHSNLTSGYPSMSMRSAVDLWMNDSDKDNIETVGHRRWLLYPSLSKVGFGKADSGYGGGGSFCAAYVKDDSLSAYTSTRVAWPANNTPTGFFKDDTAWSLSIGRVVDASKVKIKVIREKDHKVWTFTSSSADGDFYVNNGGYGAVGCIIFRPEDLDVEEDDSYTVKAFFYDKEEMIKYKVNFFGF